MKRLIVFGNRDYPNRELVESELALHVATGGYRTIVHGDCPTGADRFAKDWALAYKSPRPFMTPLVEEGHPADFRGYGRSAGPRRNEKMVSLGASFALGFWDGKVRGTVGRGSRDMLMRLIRAKIPVLMTPEIVKKRTLFYFGTDSVEDSTNKIAQLLQQGVAVHVPMAA